MNWYRIKTALGGLKRLAKLSDDDKQACIDAYKFFQRMQSGEQTETVAETKAVADYYKVLNNLLSVFDLEKLYIPPQLDESQGLYGNQLLVEQHVLKELDLKDPNRSHLLDMGCGRGRVSYHFATLTGGQVSGYNIDPNQIEWATITSLSSMNRAASMDAFPFKRSGRSSRKKSWMITREKCSASSRLERDTRVPSIC